MLLKHHTKSIGIALSLIAVLLFLSCGSKVQLKKQRDGNREIITAMDGSVAAYRIIYTYDGPNIVRGEYWTPAEPKDKKAKSSPKTNILSGTAIVKKFDEWLKGSKPLPDKDINLGMEKDSFVLQFVKKAKYNRNNLPVEVITRGYAEFPFLGYFKLNVDTSYEYNSRGQLTKIVERNSNIDSVLLNMGIGNLTIIKRDSKGRPTDVVKTIGSVPPVVELTSYSYAGDNLDKTVYKKAGIDFKKLAVVPQKTITIWYNSGVSWEGKRKYYFDLMNSENAVAAFSIYNNIEKKYEIDLANFKKMSKLDQLKQIKAVYDLYKNEQKGPKWRMGELPDVPEPFLMYKELTWY